MVCDMLLWHRAVREVLTVAEIVSIMHHLGGTGIGKSANSRGEMVRSCVLLMGFCTIVHLQSKKRNEMEKMRFQSVVGGVEGRDGTERLSITTLI